MTDKSGAGQKTGKNMADTDVSRHRAVIALLKIIIVAIALALLATQTLLLPLLADEAAHDDPVHAYLRVPYLILSIGILCCFEVALGALWHLLSMTREGRVFNASAFRWVDVIVWSAGVSAVLTGALLVHSITVSAGPPLFGLILIVVLMAEIGFALLVSVMRSLLVAATGQHDELEAVI